MGQRDGEFRSKLQSADPEKLARNSGAQLEEGELKLKMLGETYRVSLPDYEIESSAAEVDEADEQLILSYLSRLKEGGVEGEGEWLSFRELPDGNFYSAHFKKSTEVRLTRLFQNDIEGFKATANSLAGGEISISDAGYGFQILPRFKIGLVFWSGGNEFSDEVNVLFEDTAADCLSTEGLSIIGNKFCGQFIKKSQGVKQ